MPRLRSLVKDINLEMKVIEVIRKAGKPVSIDYVAYHCGISWATARAILFRLVAEGKIKAMDTTKSWIFFIPTVREVEGQ